MLVRRWVVYLAQERPPVGHGLVKVGATSDPKRRLQALRGASDYEVTMERIIETDHKQIALWFERALHLELRPFHIRGEWFRDVPAVWAVFQKYQDDGFAAASLLEC